MLHCLITNSRGFDILSQAGLHYFCNFNADPLIPHEGFQSLTSLFIYYIPTDELTFALRLVQHQWFILSKVKNEKFEHRPSCLCGHSQFGPKLRQNRDNTQVQQIGSKPKRVVPTRQHSKTNVSSSENKRSFLPKLIKIHEQ